MPFSIKYNADADLCELVVTGVYDEALTKETRSAALKIILEHDCYRILIDCREATLDSSLISLFYAPEEIKEKLSTEGIPAYKIKRAFVIRESVQNFSFYETVSVNRGLQVKIFFDMDEAINWLNSK